MMYDGEQVQLYKKLIDTHVLHDLCGTVNGIQSVFAWENPQSQDSQQS